MHHSIYMFLYVCIFGRMSFYSKRSNYLVFCEIGGHDAIMEGIVSKFYIV